MILLPQYSSAFLQTTQGAVGPAFSLPPVHHRSVPQCCVALEGVAMLPPALLQMLSPFCSPPTLWAWPSPAPSTTSSTAGTTTPSPSLFGQQTSPPPSSESAVPPTSCTRPHPSPTPPHRMVLPVVVEWCWNVYPSTPTSSASLHLIHLVLLAALMFKPHPLRTEDKEK